MPAGRPRTRDSKKKFEGAQPCRVDRVTPKPPAGGVGPCPEHLDEIGEECWHRLAAILDAMGLLTSADADALMIYCSNYSLWVRALCELKRDGLTVPTQFSFKPHPMLAVINRCEAQMNKILGQFGMSPAARSSLDLGVKNDDDDFDKYVKEKQAKKNGSKKASKPGDPAGAGQVGPD